MSVKLRNGCFKLGYPKPPIGIKVKNISFCCKYIIFFLVAITTIASTCYSNSNYKEFQYYLKQFDEGKTIKNKVISNLFILEKLLEQELFDSAQKRIQWHRVNVKDGNFDERIKYMNYSVYTKED